MSELIKDIRLVSAEKYKEFTTDNISDDNIAYLINSEELLLKSDFNTFKTTVPTKEEVSSTYATKVSLDSFETKDNASTLYLKKTEAEATYLQQKDLNDIARKSEIPDVSPYLTSQSAASTYATKEETASLLQSATAESTYLKKSDAATSYLLKTDASSLYIPKTESETFLKTDTADSVYLTKSSAESTYAKKTDIPTNYVTQSDAEATYLKKTDAETTYQKKTELQSALDDYITKKYANDNLVTQESLNKQKVVLHAVKEITPQGVKQGAKIKFDRTDNIVQVSFGGLGWGMFGILPFDQFKEKRENSGYKWFQFARKQNPSDENSGYTRLQLVPEGYRAEGAVITTICLDNGEVIGTLYIGGKDDENIIVLRIANDKVDAAVSQNFRVSPAFYLTTDSLPQETRGNKIAVPQ